MLTYLHYPDVRVGHFMATGISVAWWRVSAKDACASFNKKCEECDADSEMNKGWVNGSLSEEDIIHLEGLLVLPTY